MTGPTKTMCVADWRIGRILFLSHRKSRRAEGSPMCTRARTATRKRKTKREEEKGTLLLLLLSTTVSLYLCALALSIDVA
jgi:hypothetical protein